MDGTGMIVGSLDGSVLGSGLGSLTAPPGGLVGVGTVAPSRMMGGTSACLGEQALMAIAESRRSPALELEFRRLGRSFMLLSSGQAD
jgi:hypothetical protein